MTRGQPFTDRAEFEQILQEISRTDGGTYEDIRTIYGDMSRLVVAWLAREPPEKIARLYNELGWKGSANVRALHEAARHWMKKYHPGRVEEVTNDSG